MRYTDFAHKYIVRGQARQNILRTPLVYDNVVRNAELNKNTKNIECKVKCNTNFIKNRLQVKYSRNEKLQQF